MILSHDHKAQLMGSVLTRVDRFEDGDLRWERIDSLAIHRDGHFDWHTHTRVEEAGQPAQLHAEHVHGGWQVVGMGDGPHFLQLGTDQGDMFSFAIQHDSADSYLLNKKPWTCQKFGVLKVAA